LDEAHYRKAIERLFGQLENRYHHWRQRRDPEDNTLFNYALLVAQGSDWHTFHFSVDDTMTADHLFVVGVIHEVGAVGI
jgi:hypothetical protein